MRKKLLGAGAAMLVALGTANAPASAEDSLSVVSYGGAFENAMIQAWLDPYTKETGTTFAREQYDGGLAKLRAMVESGNTTWDLIDLESNDAITGCDEGLLQKLDTKILGDTADFLDGAILPCAVAMMTWSTVYAYDTTKFQTPPTTIADFFDTEKFPGKRGVRKSPKGFLEWALMADGVAADKVYETLGTPEGVDQAFKKLDAIKSQIVWWEAGSQPPQLLADGAVALTMAYNGRIHNAQMQENRPFTIVWDGQVYDYEWWGIPTGTKKTEAAAKFIEYAMAPDNIWKLSNFISYSPPRKSAVSKIDPKVLPHMPTAPDNFKNALQINAEFWADNFDSINNRFMTWLSQ